MDLIDRQAAIDWLSKEWNGMVCTVFDGIRTLPSAQPERKKAHIIDQNPYGQCSECGYLIDIRDGYNYCPNCGCRMEVEHE